MMNWLRTGQGETGGDTAPVQTLTSAVPTKTSNTDAQVDTMAASTSAVLTDTAIVNAEVQGIEAKSVGDLHAAKVGKKRLFFLEKVTQPETAQPERDENKEAAAQSADVNTDMEAKGDLVAQQPCMCCCIIARECARMVTKLGLPRTKVEDMVRVGYATLIARVGCGTCSQPCKGSVPQIGCTVGVPVWEFDGPVEDWEDGKRRSEVLFPDTWQFERYYGTVVACVNSNTFTVSFEDGEFDIDSKHMNVVDEESQEPGKGKKRAHDEAHALRCNRPHHRPMCVCHLRRKPLYASKPLCAKHTTSTSSAKSPMKAKKQKTAHASPKSPKAVNYSKGDKVKVYFAAFKDWFEGSVEKVRVHKRLGQQIEVYFACDDTVSWLTTATTKVKKVQ